MKTLCSLLLIGLLLSSCAERQQAGSPPTQQQWTKANVTGLRIELIDPVAVESMTFTPDGLVPLTAGVKNGAVTAPLFYWQLASGRLLITSDGKQRYDEFTLVSRDATTLTVRRHNGKIAKYKILRE
jgi:uncharacterized protein YcfL